MGAFSKSILSIPSAPMFGMAGIMVPIAGEHARGGSWHRTSIMMMDRLPWRRRALPSATLDKMRSKL